MTANAKTHSNLSTTNQKDWSDYLGDAWNATSSFSLLSPENRIYELEREKDRYKEETGYTVANDPDGVIRGILYEHAESVSLDPTDRGPLGLIGSISKKSKVSPQNIFSTNLLEIKKIFPFKIPKHSYI